MWWLDAFFRFIFTVHIALLIPYFISLKFFKSNDVLRVFLPFFGIYFLINHFLQIISYSIIKKSCEIKSDKKEKERQSENPKDILKDSMWNIYRNCREHTPKWELANVFISMKGLAEDKSIEEVSVLYENMCDVITELLKDSDLVSDDSYTAMAELCKKYYAKMRNIIKEKDKEKERIKQALQKEKEGFILEQIKNISDALDSTYQNTK